MLTFASHDFENEADEVVGLHVRLAGGAVARVPALDGMSVMEVLRANAWPIVAECGGAAVCASCHIRVAPRWAARLPEPGSEELAKLDEIPGAGDDSRLACQVRVTRSLEGLEFDLQADSIKS